MAKYAILVVDMLKMQFIVEQRLGDADIQSSILCTYQQASCFVEHHIVNKIAAYAHSVVAMVSVYLESHTRQVLRRDVSNKQPL